MDYTCELTWLLPLPFRSPLYVSCGRGAIEVIKQTGADTSKE